MSEYQCLNCGCIWDKTTVLDNGCDCLECSGELKRVKKSRRVKNIAVDKKGCGGGDKKKKGGGGSGGGGDKKGGGGSVVGGGGGSSGATTATAK